MVNGIEMGKQQLGDSGQLHGCSKVAVDKRNWSTSRYTKIKVF